MSVGGVILHDGSVLLLPKEARHLFPGVNTDKQGAAVKVHATFDLIAGTILEHQFSSGAEHDSLFFPDLDDLKGMLIIADLGYYDFSRFVGIDEYGGYFLSRVKTNTQAIIVGVPKNESQANLGRLLYESKWEGNNVDITCRFEKKKEAPEFRVVGYWNEKEKKYHWYLTNLEADAKYIYPLYRSRWQVELAFKALKQSLTPDRISSAVPMIIRNLLLIYLLRFGISTGLSICLKLEKGEKNTKSPQMSAKGVNHIFQEVFHFLVRGTYATLRAFKEKLQLSKNSIKETRNPKKYNLMQDLKRELP